MKTILLILFTLISVAHSAIAEPVVYEGRSGPGVGKHIVFLAGDHEYRSEETLPALARILAVHQGFKCTVLFTVDPKSGEIDPAADNLPGTEALKTADLAVIFLRFKNLPADQMQPIVDYLDKAGPVVGLRTSTHAFRIPKDSQFSRYDYNYKGEEYARGFGRQVLGESWSGHYGRNHVMSTRLDIVPDAKSHPILSGVTKPWVQSGGYWTIPMEDSTVLALAQPLETMEQNSAPAADKDPCPGAWIRNYSGKDDSKGRVFTTTYGASEDILNDDYRRMMVNACLWSAGLEDKITADLNVDFVGEYHPTTFSFGGQRQGIKPTDIADLTTPIFDPNHAVVSPLNRKRGKSVALFDGQSLEGWNGDPAFWSVEDGAITGRTTADNPTTGNTFCVWQGGVTSPTLIWNSNTALKDTTAEYNSVPSGLPPIRIASAVIRPISTLPNNGPVRSTEKSSEASLPNAVNRSS